MRISPDKGYVVVLISGATPKIVGDWFESWLYVYDLTKRDMVSKIKLKKKDAVVRN